MTAPRILVVDDEPNIRDLLVTSLRFAGYQVRAVANGAQTISAVLEEEPDLIILDVMLPDMNGFSVTKRLRGAGTRRRSSSSRRRTRPRTRSRAERRRRRLRHQALLPRRDRRATPGDPPPHHAGRRGVDHPRRRADDGPGHARRHRRRRLDRPVPTEFKLLRYLMLNPNRVLSKAQILDHVWEYDFNGDAGIVESYISYLRRKIDPYSSEPLIQTKRGFGYMLKAGKTA
jgi:two-component system OmpR family response regulator